MKFALGVLLGAGLSLEAILDMTLPQIELAVESIEVARMKHLDMLLSPMLHVLGGKYRQGSVKRGGKDVGHSKKGPMSKNRDGGTDLRPYDAPDGEGMLRAGLSMMGINVKKNPPK